MPPATRRQTCLDFRLSAEPAASIEARDEPEGRIHTLHFVEASSQMLITAESLVITSLLLWPSIGPEAWGWYQAAAAQREFEPFLKLDEDPKVLLQGLRVRDAAQRLSGPAVSSFLLAAARLLYRVRAGARGQAESAETEPLALGADEAPVWLSAVMALVCRSAGVPSRFAAGYVALPPNSRNHGSAHEVDESPGDEAGRAGRAVGSPPPIAGRPVHFWVECLLPEGGWLGLDPSNGCLVGERHVKLLHGAALQDLGRARLLYRSEGACLVEESGRAMELAA